MESKYLSMSSKQLSDELDKLQKEYDKYEEELHKYKTYHLLLPSLDEDTVCLLEGVVFKFVDYRTLKYQLYSRSEHKWTDWKDLDIGERQWAYKYSFDNLKIVHIPTSKYYYDKYGGNTSDEFLKEKYSGRAIEYNPTNMEWFFYSSESKEAEDEWLKSEGVADDDMSKRTSHWYCLWCNLDIKRLEAGIQPFDLIEWRAFDNPFLHISREGAPRSIASKICYHSPYAKEYVKRSNPEEYKQKLTEQIANGEIPEGFCNLPVEFCDAENVSFTPMQGLSVTDKKVSKIGKTMKRMEAEMKEIRKFLSMTPEEIQAKREDVKAEAERVKNEKLQQENEKQLLVKKDKKVDRIGIALIVVNIAILCLLAEFVFEDMNVVLETLALLGCVIGLIIVRRITMKIIRKICGLKE